MSPEPELKEELAGQRRELTEAVSDLKRELGRTAEKGKLVAIGVGAAIAARQLVKLARRRSR